MKLNEEVIAKAKQAKSVEELLSLAKENDVEMTPEQAQDIFAQLNQKSGELADDELDNVAGGGCYNNNGYLMVDGNLYTCDFWQCITCHQSDKATWFFPVKSCNSKHLDRNCGCCGFYFNRICSNPRNRRQ